MGITSLFHLIVFTHHIMSFQSSEMSVVFTKSEEEMAGRGKPGSLPRRTSPRQGLVAGWTPRCLPQALGSLAGGWQMVPWPARATLRLARVDCLLRSEPDGHEALWKNPPVVSSEGLVWGETQ